MKSNLQLTFNVEHVTPEIAEQYLEKNEGNRKCSRTIVRKYANAIRRGEWRVNGETVKFSAKGKLLDGQHRLRGIVAAEKGADLCIVRGLDEDTFKTIDGGKGRNASDCLYILDYKNPLALAAAGRILFTYERGWRSNAKGFRSISNDEMLDTIKRHPTFEPAAQEYMTRPNFTPLIPHSVGMFCFYVAINIDARKTRKFFLELSTQRYSNDSKTYPVRVLRNALHERSQEYIKPTSREKLAWMIEGWNHFLKGQGLQRISRVVEDLPTFYNDPIKRVRG